MPSANRDTTRIQSALALPFLFLPWRYYDRHGSAFLSEEGVHRIKHYEGTPLLTDSERNVAKAPSRYESAVWFVGERRRLSLPMQANGTDWHCTQERDFLDAFHWQPMIVIERWERHDERTLTVAQAFRGKCVEPER